MRAVLMVLLWIIFVDSMTAQQIDPRLEGLEIEINNLMEKHNTVGLSVVIIENDSSIFSKGFGYRDLEQKLPVTPNTCFPIASVSKAITATLIGIYEGQEKLRIADKPRQHIPYLELATAEMNSLVTIEDLLSHRSGIGVVDATHVFFPTDNIKKHLSRLKHLTPNGAVREGFLYSNMGYAILGEITAQLTGKTWAENIQTEVFQTLGMSRSSCTLSELQKSNNFSLGYGVFNHEIFRVAYENHHESAAAGAINSTAVDLAKWVRMLLNKGINNGKQIVPQNYLERSFSEQNIIRGSFSFDKKYDLLGDAYGYGWFVHQYKNLYRVNHGGNSSGFTSSVTLYPYKNLGIVILCNQESANSLTRAIEDVILNRLLEKEGKKWDQYEIQIGEIRRPIKETPGIKTDNKPTHSLEAFCGKYFAQAYGTAEVLLEDGNLMVQLPAFKMAFEHYENNVFINRMIENHHQNAPSFYFSFHPNDKGKISEMHIQFSQEPAIFSKIE